MPQGAWALPSVRSKPPTSGYHLPCQSAKYCPTQLTLTMDPELPLDCITTDDRRGLYDIRCDRTAWTPQDGAPHMFRTAVVSGLSFTAFTDGSTLPGGETCSGYAIVWFNSQDMDGHQDQHDLPEHVTTGGFLKASGNNYMAELVAILACLMRRPSWNLCLTPNPASGLLNVMTLRNAAESKLRAAGC